MSLSVVLNVHREGLWAYKAFRSAVVAARKLQEATGSNCEIIVVADRPDEETMRAINAVDHGTAIPVQVRVCDFGDLGLSRNHGVTAASMRYVAFLDGDDIWGSEWAMRGMVMLDTLNEKHPGYVGRFIAHPCMNVDFGDGAFWWTQPDQRQADFNPGVFWNTNCWSSGAMASRELLFSTPYRRRGHGLGFEDWEWNARTLAAGNVHVSVPDAVVFIRKKRDGLNVDSARKRQLIAHSDYFECDTAALPTHDALGKVPQPMIEQDQLIKEWKRAHAIEPELWPDVRQMQDLPRYEAGAQAAVPSLARAIARRVTTPPTHVILAPHLVQGGADKRIVEYAAAVARAGGKPLILLTDRESDDSWAKHMPDGVDLIDCAPMMLKAGEPSSALALTRVLMQWAPTLHVVNSRLGYALIAAYGKALRESGVSKIFCSLYASDASKDWQGFDKLGAAAFNGWFFDAREQIDMVLSDNGNHQRELARVHGWPRTKTATVPSVVQAVTDEEWVAITGERVAGKVPALRVLWASRMVRGKRIDRLIAVAKRCLELKLPILFAVAGEPADPQSRRWANELKKLQNVKITMRAFDGWKDLAPGKLDAFIFTSESEGMPNIVLEAVGHGLKVASTNAGDVGTIPFVTTVANGDDPDEWIKALLEPMGPGLLHDGIQWIRDRHSTAAFDNQLREAGYFEHDRVDAGRQEQVAHGEVEGTRGGDTQG